MTGSYEIWTENKVQYIEVKKRIKILEKIIGRQRDRVVGAANLKSGDLILTGVARGFSVDPIVQLLGHLPLTYEKALILRNAG